MYNELLWKEMKWYAILEFLVARRRYPAVRLRAYKYAAARD